MPLQQYPNVFVGIFEDNLVDCCKPVINDFILSVAIIAASSVFGRFLLLV